MKEEELRKMTREQLMEATGLSEEYLTPPRSHQPPGVLPAGYAYDQLHEWAKRHYEVEEGIGKTDREEYRELERILKLLEPMLPASSSPR